jgi:hypothetical protein
MERAKFPTVPETAIRYNHMWLSVENYGNTEKNSEEKRGLKSKKRNRIEGH